MNLSQVQVFRLLLRYTQKSLVDLAYAFYCRKIDSTEIVSRVSTIDSTLLNILSTFDGCVKLEHTKKYFETEFPKLSQVKTKYFSDFENDIKQFKTDFQAFVDKKLNEKQIHAPPDEISGRFQEITILENPFSSVQVSPFPLEDYIYSFKKYFSLEKTEIQEFLDWAFLYSSFYCFLKQLAYMEDYKAQIDAGNIPNEGPDQTQDEDLSPGPKKGPIGLKGSSMSLNGLSGLQKSKAPPADNSKNPISLMKIEGVPLLHEQENKLSKLHQGSLSLNGIIPESNNLNSNSKIQTPIVNSKLGCSSPTEQSSNETEIEKLDNLLENMDSNDKLHDWNEIIVARLQQKTLLLEKENQIIRESIDIVTKQNMEIQNLYEDHIFELLRQNEYLKQENQKLKEKNDPSLQSDDEDSLI